jgi:ABC-type sugar transport system substrate-binding protein
VYMQSSFALAGTLQLLKQRGLLTPPDDAKHVFVVSNDGIPKELQDIAAGNIDATVSQPADLYAKYALYYVKAAIDGKAFQPGPTDHDSTIIQVRAGVLEDQLSAPLVTRDGLAYGGVPSLKPDDKSLWGNNIG